MVFNYMEEYNQYCDQLESPQIFIDTAALMTLSAILDGRVWISEGGFYYSPQIYSLLIGRAGLGKSTALEWGVNMHLDHLDRESFIIEGDYTHRALMDYLNDVSGNCGERTSAWICSDEAESFFGSYTGEEMIKFLTQCFNVRKNVKYATAHSGKVFIKKPYLVFCGNATPGFLEGGLKTDLLLKGFIRRCLFIYAEKKRKTVARPKITLESTQSFTKCVEWLKGLLSVGGEFRISDSAWEWFEKWYDRVEKEDHGVLNDYWAGRRALVWKYAMLFSLSKRTDLIILPEDLIETDNYLKRVEKGMEKILRSQGKNLDSPLRYGIMDFLGNEEMSLATIAQRFKNDASATKIKELLKDMVLSEDLEERREGIGLTYKVKGIKE